MRAGAPQIQPDLASDPGIANERALVQAAAHWPEIIPQAALSHALFNYDVTRRAWEMLTTAYDSGTPLIVPELAKKLTEAGVTLEAITDALFGSEHALLAGGEAHVKHYANEVRAAARLRERHRVADAVRNGASAASISDLLARIEASSGGHSRLSMASINAVEMARMEIDRPASILGDGLLSAGGFAILYGQPGLGKTWIALLLARSLVRGDDFLGLETSPCSVGFLELEIDGYTIQQRMVAMGIGSDPRDISLRVVARPSLRGVVNMLDSEHILDIKRWVETQELQVLMIDALSRAHSTDENSSEEFGKVLAAVDRLRHETGCAILMLHHERKTSTQEKEATNDLDALRGTSRLQSDPTLLVRLKGGALRSLVFAKVSTGATPDPIFFSLDEDTGIPTLAASPDSVAEGNRSSILGAIRSAGRELTYSDLRLSTGYAERTVRKHVKSLLAEGVIVERKDWKLSHFSPVTGISGKSLLAGEVNQFNIRELSPDEDF